MRAYGSPIDSGMSRIPTYIIKTESQFIVVICPPATRAKIGPVASLDSPLRSVISLISNKFKVISYLTHPTFIYSLSDQVNSADDKIANSGFGHSGTLFPPFPFLRGWSRIQTYIIKTESQFIVVICREHTGFHLVENFAQFLHTFIECVGLFR